MLSRSDSSAIPIFDLDELRAIPLLQNLQEEHLVWLSKNSAHLRLQPGEWAVAEGDGKGFFIVLSGAVEIVKRIEGGEKILGRRPAKSYFGEVPIQFGVVFPAGYRAVDSVVRIARLEAQHFNYLAQVCPALGEEVAARARERVQGLSAVQAESARSMTPVLVCERTCKQGRQIRTFLSRFELPVEWVTMGSPDFASKWNARDAISGEDLPAIRCVDGSVLKKVTLVQLAEKMRLHTCPKHASYDLIIVGAGPAGLGAAVYGGAEGLRTLVVEASGPGGQAGTSTRIENYLGFPHGISGDDLAQRAFQQASRLGAEVVCPRGVQSVDTDERVITLDNGQRVSFKGLVIATGVSWRMLSTPGFATFLGQGVYYGSSRTDAHMMVGGDVQLIGAGNSAGQAALFYSRYAASVQLIVRGDSLERTMSHYLITRVRATPNIRVDLHSEISAAHGNEKEITSVDVLNKATGAVENRPSRGVYVFIGADAETSWIPKSIAKDAQGYILTGEDARSHWSQERPPMFLETSVPGIFAVGDVRASPVKRVAAAVGEGSMAVSLLQRYLATTNA